MKVTFSCHPHWWGIAPPPVPARALIPDWYKKLGGVGSDRGEGIPVRTIKRCVPFLDALCAGWIMRTHTEVYLRVDEQGNTNVTWKPSYETVVNIHDADQTEGSGWGALPKWNSPWSMQTPPGWSLLVIPVMNRESFFAPICGIVDTDRYPVPVNFPFKWNIPGNPAPYSTFIPKGSPIAQMIPFKREDEWELVVQEQSEAMVEGISKMALTMETEPNVYRNRYHHKAGDPLQEMDSP